MKRNTVAMRAYVLYQMMRADFLERVRRASFLLTLGFSVYLGYAVYSGQVALQMDDYHGVTNSAWLGTVMGLVSSVWVPLVGFYIVKNAIERDRQTRVGQILASTPMSKGFYTLGKTLSNLAVLAVMVLVLALVAVVAQLADRHGARLELDELLVPILLLGMCAVAVTAALAVLFESLPVLRGGVGNVVYFFLWIGLIVLGVPSADPNVKRGMWAAMLDYTGIGTVMGQLSARVRAIDPLYKGGASFNVGGLHAATKTFVWDGVHWTGEILLSRLALLLATVALALLAAACFDRFDPARVGMSLKGRSSGARFYRRKTQATGEIREQGEPEGSIRTAAMLARFERGTVRNRLGALVLAELRLMLNGQRWWWYAIALGLWIGCVATPLEAGRGVVLAFAWIWPLLLWSQMGTRETFWGTGALVFSGPNAAARQLAASYLAGVTLAAATGGGVAVRLLLGGDVAGLSAWAAGVLFIPALALALGVLSGSRKPFEALYTIWWYVGPLHHIRGVDFMGTTATSSTAPEFAVLALVLVAGAYGLRRTRLALA